MRRYETGQYQRPLVFDGGNGGRRFVNAFDAVIIGGGLHGCSAALHLARRGLKPVVIEKNWPGRHAWGVNAGGVRTLLRDPAEIPLSLAARELWHDIAALVDEDCGYMTVGQVAVAETEADLDRLRARQGVVRQLGYDHEELIDADELRRIVPALAHHCLGGLIVREDGYASPYHTTLAFRRKAEVLGATILTGRRAGRPEHRAGVWHVTAGDRAIEAPILINCAGAWAGGVASMLGDETPFQHILPMMMVSGRTAPFVDPVVIGTGRPLSFKQMANGTVVIGGGYLARGDTETETSRIDFAGLKRSAATVRALFPNMAGVPIVRTWAGFEGRMADEIPVIGPSVSAPGAYHAFGFSGHGFQLGPIVGRALADLIVDGATDLPIEPFAVDRF
jgi:sarcosine oxidase subunit beta